MREINSIRFFRGDSAYSNVFSGGTNNIEPQFADIDADGDYDLLYLCSDGSFELMQNTGTASDPVFELRLEEIPGLDLKDWFYLVDIDADGDYDLFTGGEANLIRFLRNTGTSSSPLFEIEIDTLRDTGGNLMFSESVSNSVFADVDSDNDYDFVTGNQAGTLNFYENIGTSQTFAFDSVELGWQDIIIIGGVIESKHGASALEFGDVDGDADLDLIWGDFFSTSLYFLENQGDPQNPDINLVYNVYPYNDDSLKTSGFNMPRLVDIDGDMDLDLTASVLYDPTVPQSLIFFENMGNAIVPDFRRITDDYLNLLDVGTKSVPALADLDGDGDKDMLIGSEKNPFGTLYFFENTGTAVSPEFRLMDTNYFNISGELSIAPSLGDLDGDADNDLLIGGFLGKIELYENTGDPGSPAFSLTGNLTDLNGTEIKVSNFIRPVLIDVDGDADNDLIVGAFNGRIILYRNIGSTSSFLFQLDEGYFSGIDVGDQSFPFMTDIDNDSDLDLFAGNRDGKIFFYRNDGTSADPSFTPVSENYIDGNFGMETVPYFVDIDGDTDQDIFIGNIKGGLYFFRNLSVTQVETDGIRTVPAVFNIIPYPNPFNSRVKIFMNVNQKGFYAVEIFNILGKKIETLFYGEIDPGKHDFYWETDGLLSSGIYFIRAGNEFINKTAKVILLK